MPSPAASSAPIRLPVGVQPPAKLKKRRKPAIWSLVTGLISLGAGAIGIKTYLNALELWDRYHGEGVVATQAELEAATKQYLTYGIKGLVFGIAALAFGIICVVTSHKKLVQLILGTLALAAAILALFAGGLTI
ncbi:MAG: hypothetical protein LBR19_08255, partial [Bifidobacteriaceae bacterium]|nr:hypothetical protein [Bifidobacteriaceae bacterium]